MLLLFQFGQRDNQTQLKYFTDPAEFFKLVTDDTNIIESVFMVNPEMVSVTYSREEEFVDVLTMTNVVIAAYTTSQARLKLYSYLEPLQGRVLYMDTGKQFQLAEPLHFSSIYHVASLFRFYPLPDASRRQVRTPAGFVPWRAHE